MTCWSRLDHAGPWIESEIMVGANAVGIRQITTMGEPTWIDFDEVQRLDEVGHAGSGVRSLEATLSNGQVIALRIPDSVLDPLLTSLTASRSGALRSIATSGRDSTDRDRPRQRMVLLASVAAVALVGAALVGTTRRDVEPVAASKTSPTRPAPEAPKEYTDEELVATFGDAVFRIDVEGCGYLGSGSGFAIGDRHIVTNWHVVSIDNTPTVVGRDGSRREGNVIGATPNPDIAVIELAEPVNTVLEWADTDGLSEGQHLVGLGYPVPATEFSVAPGTVVSFQTEEGRRQAIRTDASLDRGSSGGPGLTTRGQVAGVITEMAENSDGFQNVPLLFTHSVLGPAIDQMIAAPAEYVPDCEQIDSLPEFPSDYFDDPVIPTSPAPAPVPAPTQTPTTWTVPAPVAPPATQPPASGNAPEGSFSFPDEAESFSFP